MSIANMIQEVIGDLPDPERQTITTLGQVMDSLAAGEAESAERELTKALWALKRNVTAAYRFPAALDVDRMLRTDPPARDWVLHALGTGMVGVISGPGGVGKSMIVLNILLAVAGGWDLFGRWTVGQAGPVVYVTGEEDEIDLHHRLVAQIQASQVSVKAAVSRNLRLYSVTGQPPKFLTRRADGLAQQNPDAIHPLEQILSDCQPRLLVLDPLIKFHASNENDNGEMNQMMDFCVSLAKRYHMAVILVHHTAKNADGTRQDAVRGASAIVNEARWQAAVNPLPDSVARRLNILDEDQWRYLVLSAPKINHGGQPPRLLLCRGAGGSLSLVGALDETITKQPAHPKEQNNDGKDDEAWYG